MIETSCHPCLPHHRSASKSLPGRRASNQVTACTSKWFVGSSKSSKSGCTSRSAALARNAPRARGLASCDGNLRPGGRLARFLLGNGERSFDLMISTSNTFTFPPGFRQKAIAPEQSACASLSGCGAKRKWKMVALGEREAEGNPCSPGHSIPPVYRMGLRNRAQAW